MHPATWSLKISAILLFMFQSLGSCSLWWRAEADWTAHLSDTPLWTWPSAECEMCKRRAGACVVEHAPPPALGTPLLCCCFCCVGVCAGKQSSASTNWGLDRQTFQWSVANSSAAASQPNAPGFGGGVSLQEMWILQSRPEFRLNLWTLQCVCAAQSHVSQTPAAITQGAPFEQIVPLPVAVLWDKILQYKFY